MNVNSIKALSGNTIEIYNLLFRHKLDIYLRKLRWRFKSFLLRLKKQKATTNLN
jgi:hypothetical protein